MKLHLLTKHKNYIILHVKARPRIRSELPVSTLPLWLWILILTTATAAIPLVWWLRSDARLKRRIIAHLRTDTLDYFTSAKLAAALSVAIHRVERVRSNLSEQGEGYYNLVHGIIRFDHPFYGHLATLADNLDTMEKTVTLTQAQVAAHFGLTEAETDQLVALLPARYRERVVVTVDA